MNKIAVVTFCTWTSYGSILQSYSLQNYFKSKGDTSFIISKDTKPDKFRPSYLGRVKSFKQFLRFLLSLFFYRKINIQFIKNNSFIKNKIDIRYYHDYDSICSATFDVDYFVSGSDQVFDAKKCDKLFYLDFVNNANKCVSYAASFGSKQAVNKDNKELRRLLNNFNHISVREKIFVDILKTDFNIRADFNIDPVFLTSRIDWILLEEYIKTPSKYILVYPIYWDKRLNQELKLLKKKTGLKIVVLDPNFSTAFGDVHIRNAGVGNFIYLINHSEGVITSSFHGFAMALLLNKKVCPILNPSSPERLKDLMDYFGIKQKQINDFMSNGVDLKQNMQLIEKAISATDLYFKKVFTKND